MNTALKYAVGLIVLWPCSVGCGRVEKDSSLDGRVAGSSFPSTPTSIEARAQDGSVVQVALGADGSFHLPLKPGTYTVSVVLSGGREPLVFPRKNGQLDATFTVTSPNASVNLGEIRHLDSAPAAGFTMTAAGANCAGDQVCIDDDNAASCESEDDDENEQEGEHGDEHEGSEAEGDATDALDVNASEAVTGSIAIAERNVPDQVGCGESEEEHED